MNVYVKCFEIPDRLRASLNPDECEVLEVDGVPFIDEYGVFSPLDGLRIDPSGRYLLFCESKIDSLVGIDLVLSCLMTSGSARCCDTSRAILGHGA